MFKKLFSCKVARVFEVFGSLMLIPSIPSLIFPLLGLIKSLIKLSLEGILYSATCFTFFGLGFILFVGYFKHSRAMLDEEKIIPLWIGTFLFNLILFSSGIYFYPTYIIKTTYDEPKINEFFFVWTAFILWFAIAVMLSMCAIISEVKGNQK